MKIKLDYAVGLFADGKRVDLQGGEQEVSQAVYDELVKAGIIAEVEKPKRQTAKKVED